MIKSLVPRGRERRPRLFYAAGPGNVIGTYEHWREGQDDSNQVAITYSGQFYDLCRELGADAMVVASHGAARSLRDGQFRIEHRPIPLLGRRGVLYHLGQIRYTLGLAASILRFRATVAVVGGIDHWYPLAILKLLGVEVIPSLHCVLWPKYRPPRGVRRLVCRANLAYFERVVRFMMCVSEDVGGQVNARGRCQDKVMLFKPTYRSAIFADAQPPPDPPPFRVLYAGRIERDKGVFDILEAARMLTELGRTEVEFELCGAGSALDELRAAASEAGLEDRFRIHGHCTRSEMRSMYARSHAVIVPTRTDFEEGLNKVVVESILARRPVITSSVCPALAYVRDAVVEVPPDDVDAYVRAILHLTCDPDGYDRKRRACALLSGPFLDQ